MVQARLDQVLYGGRVLRLEVDSGNGASSKRSLWYLRPCRMRTTCRLTGATIELHELAFQTSPTIAKGAFEHVRISQAWLAMKLAEMGLST